jgi:microcystin-dependent protein
MASLVSGISVTNGTIITPAILNANPSLVGGTVTPSDLTTGAPSWDGSGNVTLSGNGTFSGNVTATSFAGSGSSLTGIASVPAGAVMPFIMNSAPSGWLICNGNVVPNGSGTVQGITANFAALYALLGTTYGTAGTLPDLRGYFIRGYGTNSNGTASGAFGAKQTDAFQGHIHGATTTARLVDSGGNIAGGSNYDATRLGVVTITNPISDGTNGTPRTANETRPANIAMLYCIKY